MPAVVEFECNELNDSTVMMMYLDRDRIYLDPPYQRQSEVWTLYKKQLLIDSLINSFDIPKLYLHEFERAEIHGGALRKYAIVDGKQRLSAIWEFLEGGFALSDQFEYIRDPKVKLKGMTYEELSNSHPTIQARFTGRRLSVITIRTSDTDLIEDMFSRLNEAVPLNAAEKRNAFGGPVPKAIRALVEQPFFTTTLPITPKRYRHHDLACKFLLLQHEKKIVDTKKSRLDAFVNDFKDKALNLRTVQLRKAVQANLSKMEKFFRKDDPLLSSPLMCAVYYALFMDGTLGDSKPGKSRKTLVAFESELEANRQLELKESEDVNFALLEYDRIARSPNDASTISFRVRILKDYLEEA
jgi:Protein of unknown function DUF262